MKMSEKKSSSKKLKSTVAKSRVVIKGEGRDEWGTRYFKFSVVGSDSDIPPFSIEQFFSDSKPVFAALANAGWNGFTNKARNGLLEKLQKRKPEPPSFEVVTRLGWNSGAYVFPEEIVGKPKKPLQKAFVWSPRSCDAGQISGEQNVEAVAGTDCCPLQGQFAADVQRVPRVHRADLAVREGTQGGWVSNLGRRRNRENDGGHGGGLGLGLPPK
jgi:hypothetical protein